MPNTDADKQATGGTETPGDSTASQNQNNQGSSGEDANSQPPKSNDQKAIDRAFFEVREKGREIKEKDSQLSQLQAQINELKTSRSSDSDIDTTQVDIQKELESFKGKLLQEFEGRENAKRISQEEQKADKWLSSRQYIMEDSVFADAVAGVIHSQYAEVAKINPMVAAKQAYQDVCSMKGVVDATPDLSSARASGGLGTSAPASVGPKADAKVYKSILDDTNWSDPVEAKAAKVRLAELKKARQ